MPIPDFVLALRSHIGKELLWMPGVSAVVVHEDGRLLLGRRADNGLWAVVSGILEPGEQPAVGAGDPWVADDESTAVGWFEAGALPEPLMKSSQARIAHAMAYRANPEDG